MNDRTNDDRFAPAAPAAPGAARYVLVVRGTLDARWSAWFDGLTITPATAADGRTRTLLEGDVRDQAALHGLLARVRDLNLTLLGVYRIENGESHDA